MVDVGKVERLFDAGKGTACNQINYVGQVAADRDAESRRRDGGNELSFLDGSRQ
jgi:hypothetical protein